MDLFDLLKSTKLQIWYVNGSFTTLNHITHERLSYHSLSDIVPFDIYIPPYIGRMRFSTAYGSYVQASDVTYDDVDETFYEFYDRAMDQFGRKYNGV